MVNPLFCSIRSVKQAAQSHISTGWQNLDYNSDLSDLKVLAVSMQLYYASEIIKLHITGAAVLMHGFVWQLSPQLEVTN